MDRNEKRRPEEKTTLQALGFVSGLGLYFAATIAVCIFLGKIADKYLECAPWGSLIGIIGGFFAGIWTTYKKLLGKQP